jgi:deazaflavin-dependent oxidoreductase (nitroreductase family)
VATLRDRLNKTMSGWHRRLYVRSGQARRMRGAPLLLLTTVGRRSGQRRAVPLMYLADGERWVVVASNGGQDHDPDWYRNLLEQPLAEVRVGDDELPVVARVLGGEERAAVWPRLVSMYGGYAKYQRRATREIPVVVLSPR